MGRRRGKGTLAEHRGAAAAAGEVVGSGGELERVGGRRAGGVSQIRCVGVVCCEGLLPIPVTARAP